MSFFYGSEIYSVDAKGRLNIPSNMRKELSSADEKTFVAMCSPLRPCIYLYPKSAWQKFHEKNTNLAIQSDVDDLDAAMWIGEFTQTCSIGAQSKIMLSEKMLKHANISKEVRIVGSGDRLILWEPKAYEEFLKSIKDPKSLFGKVFAKNVD